jgi:hypothetical protein
MHQWWNNSHGKHSLLAFCGGGETESSLSTLAEVDETLDSRIQPQPQQQPPKLDHYQLCDSPPPSPIRVTSPSSLSTWSPDPTSPIGWNDDDVDDKCGSDCRYGSTSTPNSPRLVTSDLQGGPPQRRLAPSLFSPWLCVYDLDAACGSGSYVDSVVDDSFAVSDAPPQALQSPPPRCVVSHPKQNLSSMSQQPGPIDWNNGRLSSIDLSIWFGHRDDSKCSLEQDSTAVCEPNHGSCSDAVATRHGSKPIRPIPVYPSSRSSQYFTDFASDNGIEAIFLPVRKHMHCFP